MAIRRLPLIAALLLAGCDRSPGTAGESGPIAAQPASSSADTAGGFAPLQSDQVKDAIHRALLTGQDQRWQDGAWSGYAVPSRATLANGCRTIRYTIDQRPNAPATTINACDASKR